MRKWLLALICCLMFTGCTMPKDEQTIPTEPLTVVETISEDATESTQAEIQLTIYVPNENADDFVTILTTIPELNGQVIVDKLIDQSMLSEGIVLNRIELDSKQINLDFNQAFADQLKTYGTAGERMLIGCVVNTFLSVYDADTVYITVDGNIVESGHVIYDFPMDFFE